MRAYLEFSAVPWRKNHLDDKTKELMYIAVDAAATHLYVPGIRQHIRAALQAGATRRRSWRCSSLRLRSASTP